MTISHQINEGWWYCSPFTYWMVLAFQLKNQEPHVHNNCSDLPTMKCNKKMLWNSSENDFFLNKQKTVGYGTRITDLIYKRFDERNYIQEVNQHDSDLQFWGSMGLFSESFLQTSKNLFGWQFSKVVLCQYFFEYKYYHFEGHVLDFMKTISAQNNWDMKSIDFSILFSKTVCERFGYTIRKVLLSFFFFCVFFKIKITQREPTKEALIKITKDHH